MNAAAGPNWTRVPVSSDGTAFATVLSCPRCRRAIPAVDVTPGSERDEREFRRASWRFRRGEGAADDSADRVQ